MQEPVITCPQCRSEIKLTESLAAPLIQSLKTDYEKRLAQTEEAMAQREQSLREQQRALKQAQAEIDEQVGKKLDAERQRIVQQEAERARKAISSDLKQKEQQMLELQNLLDQRDQKLAEAQKAQAELLRKQRELDDAKREMELNIEKRVQKGLDAARDQAKREAEDALKLRVLEKEQTITSMQKQIEDLKRRAEQGSQQLQGEVQELELESMLQTKFPLDTISPVPKGEFGGDVLHGVVNAYGKPCGVILWESKRTKNWSDGWLTKLREDQRTAKAELAVIVSHALPADVETFALMDGVWVVDPRLALPVAIALRETLIGVSSARQAGEGQQTKQEIVYEYLTGPRFRQRVQAIVEAFSTMQSDLLKERKVIMKQWAKREEQIERVMQSTVGVYGDLQGIVGKSLQEIEGLEMPALEADD